MSKFKVGDKVKYFVNDSNGWYIGIILKIFNTKRAEVEYYNWGNKKLHQPNFVDDDLIERLHLLTPLEELL